MSDENKTIKCIYCLQTKVPSREHVVPYTLGGNLTIHCVCVGCNTFMSQLDQSLSDSSLLTLSRIVEQPDATITNHASTGEEGSPFSSEIRMGHRFQSTMKAQLNFEKINDKSYKIFGTAENTDHYAKLILTIKKYISKNKLRSIPILSKDALKNSTPFPRIIQHRTNQIAFRPSNQSINAELDRDEIIAFIETNITQLEELIITESSKTPISSIQKPSVIINLSVDFGKNHRAVTKIAFNFVAHIFGPEILYSKVFDDLRSFILSGDKANESGTLWDIGEEIELGKTRFSIWVKDHAKDPVSFSKSGTHTITITPLSDRLVAFIVFYAQDTFMVDIEDITAFPNHLFPIVHEFDYVARTNRRLHPTEMLERYRDKMRS